MFLFFNILYLFLYRAHVKLSKNKGCFRGFRSETAFFVDQNFQSDMLSKTFHLLNRQNVQHIFSYAGSQPQRSNHFKFFTLWK